MQVKEIFIWGETKLNLNISKLELPASAFTLPLPGQDIGLSRIQVTCHLSSMVTCLQQCMRVKFNVLRAGRQRQATLPADGAVPVKSEGPAR